MSEERTIFLWPRHDVLHLVTPSLCQSGRNLSNSVIIEVCRQLCRVQTPDGQIRYALLYVAYTCSVIHILILHCLSTQRQLRAVAHHSEGASEVERLVYSIVGFTADTV